MSFKNLEDSIMALEDVSGAPMLRAHIKEQEEEQQKKERAHAREKKELQENYARLFESYNALKARANELTRLRVVYKNDRYSLREIDSIAKKRMDKEVKKRISKKAINLSENQLPSLIEAEIKGYPIKCSEVTRRTVEEKAAKLLDKYLRNPAIWPPWFKEKVREETDKQVIKRMDQEFWDNVQQRTNQEINLMLPSAWMSFLRGNATSFMKNTLQAQLRSLVATIEYTCPRCGGTVQITLTPDEFSLMIRKGYVSYICPYSKGVFKHNFRITLGKLFWYVMKGDVIPLRAMTYSRAQVD